MLNKVSSAQAAFSKMEVLVERNVAGVDTHRDTHSIVIVDSVGRMLKQLTIPANDEGYHTAIAEAAALGEVIWGIEGTG